MQMTEEWSRIQMAAAHLNQQLSLTHLAKHHWCNSDTASPKETRPGPPMEHNANGMPAMRQECIQMHDLDESNSAQAQHIIIFKTRQ